MHYYENRLRSIVIDRLLGCNSDREGEKGGVLWREVMGEGI
jgi:hypothetical protein